MAPIPQHPDGDRQYLIDKLQESYGIGSAVAAKRVEDFEIARYGPPMIHEPNRKRWPAEMGPSAISSL